MLKDLKINGVLCKNDIININMSEKCIYVDKNCIKCNKRAWFPFIHSRFCFKHRKMRDPYQLISKNECKKDEFIPLLPN